MIPVNPEALKPFASKYVWWKTPDEAVAMPERVIAQVMNMGDYADVQTLAVQVGDDALRAVLKHAEAGQFNERSLALSCTVEPPSPCGWGIELLLISISSLKDRLIAMRSEPLFRLWSNRRCCKTRATPGVSWRPTAILSASR